MSDPTPSPQYSLESLLRLAATELKGGKYIAIHAGNGEVSVRLWDPKCRDYGEWLQIEGLPVADQLSYILREEGILLTEKPED